MSAYTAALLASLLWFSILPGSTLPESFQVATDGETLAAMAQVNSNRRSRRRGSGRRQMLGYAQDTVLTDYGLHRPPAP